MTSTLYQFNDFHEFYNFTDCCNWGPSGVSNKEICSCCESVPYKDISFLLTETEIIDKTPNDWAEWKGDKDEEHIPEFIEDLGLRI